MNVFVNGAKVKKSGWSGTTRSAVADGTLIIRNREQQQQDVSDLSRDTEHANGSISPIFDKEKEQKRLQVAQLAGEISGQMTNIVQTLGDIKGLESAKGKYPDKTAAELRNSPEYRDAQRDYGTGGTWQMVTQSLGSVMSGVLNGNATQAAGLAGGLAGNSTAATATGAQVVKNAVENKLLGLVARGCAIAAPCRTKVAEKALEIGIKAGIKISSDS